MPQRWINEQTNFWTTRADAFGGAIAPPAAGSTMTEHLSCVSNASSRRRPRRFSTSGWSRIRWRTGCVRAGSVASPVTVEPQVGGGVRVDTDASGANLLIAGRLLAIDRPNLLCFTWSNTNWPDPTVSDFNVAFTPTGGDRTLMSIEHSLVPPTEFENFHHGSGVHGRRNRGGAVMTSNRDRKAVANTGLLVAAIRAKESAREDRLFTDPFADKLAGETGKELLAAAVAGSGERSTAQIVVRTRFFDDALLRLTQRGEAGRHSRRRNGRPSLPVGVAGRHHRLRSRPTTRHRRQSPTS